MCVTADPDLASRMSMLRDHGMDRQRRYWHTEVGYNYRMTNLQAAIGCAQLERIDAFLDRRHWIRTAYVDRLQGLGLTLPDDCGKSRSVYWLFTLLLPEGTDAAGRDALIAYLGENGVDSRPVFYPVQRMPPYQAFSRPTPNADQFSARGLTLPSGYPLTETQIDRVASLVRTWLTRHA